MSRVEQWIELSLRLRQAERVAEVADVAAFAPVHGAPDALGETHQSSGHAGMPLPAAEPGGARTIPVFLPDRSPPIPCPHSAVPTRHAAWDLPSRGSFRLAFVPPAPRSVTVMATCVTLLLPSGIALAQPAETAPQAESPAPPPVASGVALGDAFPLLVGQELELSMRDGTMFLGRLLAVQAPWLICAREDDGRVVAVLQSEVTNAWVAEERVSPQRKLPRETGAGRIAAGVSLIAGGAVMVMGGAIGAAYYGDYGYRATGSAYIWLPLVLPAAVMIGAGIPLLVRGSKIRRDFEGKYPPPKRARASRAAAIAWDGGLRLRF